MRPRQVRFVTESLTTGQRLFNGKTKTLGITAKMTSKHGSSYHLDFQTTGFE